MNPIAEDILMHYGVKRRSGRYPWGSGDNPYQHSGDFLSRVQKLKADGLTEKEIVKALNLDSTTQLRVAYRVAKNERRRLEVDRVKSLVSDGYSISEIGRMMGKNESTIRSLLNEGSEKRMNAAEDTAKFLKKQLEEKRIIDVGEGVERELGVSRNTLEEAIFMLEADEGYQRLGVGLPQVTNPGKQTTVMVLCKPDVTYGEVYKNPGEIKSVTDYHSTDGGKTFQKLEYPSSISSDRIQIRYGDDGGLSKDGVIELRRGVDDLSLGNSHYAQVRILVDGTHYLKGMAMYSDDMPDGVDIVFNTNKKTGTSKMDVLKPITGDPDNPFGAYIKANGQSYYDDPKGKYIDPVTGKKQSLSAINKLKEEGDWDTMSKTLSSQFLSKQPMKLIKQQLDLTYADAQSEFDDILKITNPTVKKKLLMDFANECDSAVVHLKAAALPRQSSKVILPIDALKDNEVYAPTYKDGEHVVLIRYPHGGTFEIPELTVNNKNASAKKILGNVTDAIGINSKVAGRLSGADFDGDSVTVIPVGNKVKVQTSRALEDLVDFDPKNQYAYHDGMSVMKKGQQTQKEMGMISNLITDMTLQGATRQELARAVKHSMVVIDAAKHKLDYKQSEKDNGIPELKKQYQRYVNEAGEEKVGGAATLLSRRGQTVQVPERKGSPRVNPDTGELVYKESGRTYVNKEGKTVAATSSVPLPLAVSDVHKLSSGSRQEEAYADYANKMRALANEARKAYAKPEKIEYSKSARETYDSEVKTLEAKLDLAARNAPRERQAQAIANSEVKAKLQSNPELSTDKKALRKIKQIAMNNARAEVSASSKDRRINITDKEWEAIQAGAISSSKLNQILRYADPDDVRQKATPKTRTEVSQAKANKIRAMSQSNYTIAEIAEQMGLSPSTVSKYLNG